MRHFTGSINVFGLRETFVIIVAKVSRLTYRTMVRAQTVKRACGEVTSCTGGGRCATAAFRLAPQKTTWASIIFV